MNEPAMKKKNKSKILPVVLIALIVLSVAAIIYVIQFSERESPAVRKRVEQTKPKPQPKTIEKNKPAAKASAKTPAPAEASQEKSPTPPKTVTKPPEKEKVVVAKVIPPRLPLKQIAIIIDDIGHDLKPVDELLGIDADITFAILPLVAHSREAAIRLHQAKRETLLHLPMEPLAYPKEKPGEGALFTDMNHDELIFQLGKNLDSVPYASGVNNHMGSRFMADEEKLILVFQQLKKRNLFFIDSRTTGDSKTAVAAGKVHLKIASRRIFLDNERDHSKIYQILMNAAEEPAGHSPLILIGHPYPETIRAIKDASKVLREKGVSIVPVSKLLPSNAS